MQRKKQTINYPFTRINQNLHKTLRINLINALSGFKQAMLLGTCDTNGNTNLAMIGSITHLSSKPAKLSLLMRAHGLEQNIRRDSLKNIVSTGCFTLNHVHADILEAAHQTSAKYEPNISEFEQTGLTPTYSNTLAAPYVEQAHISFGCRFEKLIDLETNQLELVIAEIIEANIPENLFDKEGRVNLSDAGSLAVAGCDYYHQTIPHALYDLARPGQPPLKLK